MDVVLLDLLSFFISGVAEKLRGPISKERGGAPGQRSLQEPVIQLERKCFCKFVFDLI